jgi:hypothetical protein
MRMTAWLQAVPPWLLIAVALVALAAALALAKDTRAYGDELRQGPAHADVVTLQLAFSAEKGVRIRQDWAGRTTNACCPGHEKAACETPLSDCALKSIRADWGFILAYVVFGFAGLIALLRLLRVPVDGYWLAISLLPLGAGALDVGENLLHLWFIDAGGPSHLVIWASLLAGGKLLLLGIALVAAVTILGFWLFSQPWARNGGPSSKVKRATLPEVLEKEAEYLRSRRTLVSGPAVPEESPWIGLAMSGGGIRSATVNLGVLQALLASPFFRRGDYLSSVSGGGYIAAALSSLLSFKTKRVAADVADPEQYEFRGPEDRPHFDVNDPRKQPFNRRERGLEGGEKPWLTGRMVTEHLLAYGEYLVRRRRLLSRDVLRAIGTVSSGIAAMLVLFGLAMMLVAAATAAVIEASGVDLSQANQGDLSGYWTALWSGVGGLSGLLAVTAFGGVAVLAVLYACGWVAIRTPAIWFCRDGDTVSESRQHRALWIAGGMIAFLGLVLLPVVGALRGVAPGQPSLFLVPGFFLGGLVATGLAYVLLSASLLEVVGLRSSPATRSYISGANGLCLYLLMLGGALALLPWVLSALHTLGAPEAGVGLFAAVASGILAWLQKSKKEGDQQIKKTVEWVRSSGEFLLKLALGVAVAALLVAALILALAALVSILEPVAGANPGAVAFLEAGAAVLAALVILGFLIDFNKLSMHYFYRDRLVEAYLATDGPVRGSGVGDLEPKRDNSEMRLTQLHGDYRGPPRSEMDTAIQQQAVPTTLGTRLKWWGPAPIEKERFSGAATAAPYHLVCTCLNLTSDRDMRLRSRRSDVFVFSKLFCGSSVTGFVDTTLYRSGATKLARAVTISGAAADSAMGQQTFFAQSFATTLFNIRLGQWLENPRFREGRDAHRWENWIFWPSYLLKEVFGISDSRGRLVHLSDGGHTGDNLGIIPLLQRRCGLVLAVDAECDPKHRFGSLMNALRYAEIDLDVKIEMNLSSLELKEEDLTDRHLAIGYIHYPETPLQPASKGVLFYLKASVAALEGDPESIRQYRKSHPEFPHETTADQFFSEAQFEAYRVLGQVLGNSLTKECPELAEPGFDAKQLIENLWQRRA